MNPWRRIYPNSYPQCIIFASWIWRSASSLLVEGKFGVMINKYFPQATWLLQIKRTRQDTIRDVDVMLHYDPNPESMKAGLQAEIMNRNSETYPVVYAAPTFRSKLDNGPVVAPGFLLVSLSIPATERPAILNGTTSYDSREQPKRMTNCWGLGDAHLARLDAIKAPSKGKSSLVMVSFNVDLEVRAANEGGRALLRLDVQTRPTDK